MRTTAHFSIFILSLLCIAPTASAAILAGQVSFNAFAIQDVTIPVGSPLNTGTVELTGTASGAGIAALQFSDQVGDSIEITSLAGGWVFNGSINLDGNPNPIPVQFGVTAAFDGDDYSGSMSNVVQSDPNSTAPSSLTSADLFFTGPGFGIQIPGVPELVTDPNDPFAFVGQLNGLPPGIDPPNSPFIQNPIGDPNFPEPINVIGPNPTNPTENIVYAVSTNRRIFVTAVPEPGSMLLLTACCVGIGARWRMKRTTVPAAKTGLAS